MITVNINLNVSTAAEAIEAFKALQAAGIMANVTSGQAASGKRFRMTKEQAKHCAGLPENEREAYRADCMAAAGFNASEQTDIMPEDDGRDPLA